MAEIQDRKPYDLEERPFGFAKNVLHLMKVLPTALVNQEIAKQVIRSSGSVGANYIEANEALSKKDFAFRIKICRKEAKESRYWLRLLDVRGEESETMRQLLVAEATELLRIFSSIVEKAV